MKLVLLLFILLFIVSCAPSRVCGGSGGKRCVEASIQSNLKTIS